MKQNGTIGIKISMVKLKCKKKKILFLHGFRIERRNLMSKNKRLYGSSIYDDWVNSGKLNDVLSFIKKCAQRLVTQKEMCKQLGMNASTFSSLKKEHPNIQAAIDSAKYDLKCDLASAMYKRAIGYEVIEEDQLVEERDGKTKKKVHRIKKQVGPDYKALVYLLTKHFGKEYGESYEELLLNERKFAAKEVTWTKADEG